jgi:uncharacterized membrane-anchored protein
MTTQAFPRKSTPSWRFWIPLAFQAALVLAVPAQAVYTYMTGKTVILQTAPVDPYDPLRGYYQTLRYNISNQENLRELPGWEKLPKQSTNGSETTFIEPGTNFYVILEEPAESSDAKLPQPWQPVALSLERPSPLPEDRVALQGLAQHSFVQYGLETYYMPEDRREQINAELNAFRQPPTTPTPQTPPVVVEAKVNPLGEAVPVSIWAKVNDAPEARVRNYRF